MGALQVPTSPSNMQHHPLASIMTKANRTVHAASAFSTRHRPVLAAWQRARGGCPEPGPSALGAWQPARPQAWAKARSSPRAAVPRPWR
eukprot:14432294-Alexandrium_andersonii.AAC.1